MLGFNWFDHWQHSIFSNSLSRLNMSWFLDNTAYITRQHIYTILIGRFVRSFGFILDPAAPASPAPKGINVPARPRPAGLLPFASLCSRYDHRPPALVRHPPPVRRLLGPLSKPDPPLPPPQRHLPPPHPTPSLFLPSRALPLTSPSPRSRSFRLSLPDFPLSVANRGAEPLPSFALPSAQSTERQRVEEPPRQGTTATARQTPRRHRPLAPGSHDP